jgi:hypothetical protein
LFQYYQSGEYRLCAFRYGIAHLTIRVAVTVFQHFNEFFDAACVNILFLIIFEEHTYELLNGSERSSYPDHSFYLDVIPADPRKLFVRRLLDVIAFIG